GTLTAGNLTRILEAAGTALQQETDLTYAGADSAWGLPDSAVNEVGGVTTFSYDHPTGRLLTASSPQNLLVASGHPDRPSSVTTLAYNGDGLPSQVTDPAGHTASISYNAPSSGSGNLVITQTNSDSSTRQLLMDPMGRV